MQAKEPGPPGARRSADQEANPACKSCGGSSGLTAGLGKVSRCATPLKGVDVAGCSTGDEQQARTDLPPPHLPLPVQPQHQADQDGGRRKKCEHQQSQAQPTLALQIVCEIHR